MPDRQPHGTLEHMTDASSAYPGPLAWACCLTGCLKLESQAPRIGLCVPRRLSPTPAGPYSTVTPSPLLFHMIKLSLSQGCQVGCCGVVMSRTAGQKGLVGTVVIREELPGSGPALALGTIW